MLAGSGGKVKYHHAELACGKWKKAAASVRFLAEGILLALLILAVVELHQDRVLNEIALREKKGEIR